jgi:hypothetical protein
MIIYAATVFISAFLLFLVQPLIAKFILPWFGGSPGVWTTCLLFFQVLLTAGYAYAHLLVSRLNRRKQATITLTLLILTIASLPVTPSKTWIPESSSMPAWHILRLLMVSVGACYFLLSSTGPLLQSWFSHIWPKVSPYRLYTLANLGSLIAIVSYPVIIEPNLTLGIQTKTWSYIYVAFAVLCAACLLKLVRRRPVEAGTPFSIGDDTAASPAVADRILWLSLTALSSAMLMATTNQLCMDVAVIPMLWLLPMGLYLLSFILCFHSERLYSRLGFGIALVAALIQTCVVLAQGIFIPLPVQIASYCFTLFISCMVCHGELVRLKPKPQQLTSFYLMISAGGALGGVFVSLIAPRIFKAYWEFHLALIGMAAIFMIILFRDRKGFFHAGRPSWAWALLCLSFMALVIALSVQISGTLKDAVVMKRNFFGILRVLDDSKADPEKHRMVLMHGRIEHGCQYTAEDKRYWPTSYFGPASGIGIAIQFHPRRLDPRQRHLRIGVVGLGAGTMAAYGEKGDYFRFYEINPDVLQFSDSYFSYRKDAYAQVDVVLGDARISMEREKGQSQPGRYDVLAIDAFSSDAIPVHLFTRECYRNYWYHLKKDGILAMHISSRYFDLSPVIRSLAKLDVEKGIEAIRVEDAGNPMQGTDATNWILVTGNKEFLNHRSVRSAISPWTSADSSPILFTDDYSNLFKLLKGRD